MKILVLFVQYGQNKYPDALKNIEHLLKDICTECTFVVIDNSIETNYEEIIDGIHYINGDNTCWEFSAWDSALGRLENNIKSFDLICFATSALFAQDTTHLQFLSYDVLEAAILRNAIVGKIDITQENMALSSVHFNRWMRTSLFFMPPKVVHELGTLTTLYSEECFFSNDFRNPFNEQGIINDALKSKILFFLTAPQSDYHSRFDLSPTTLPFFKAKTHAILNEYALTLKIIQSDIPLMDLAQKSTYPHDTILHIVSPVIDHEAYSEYIQNNTYLSNENIYLYPIQNHTNNDRIPVIYNNFIRNYLRQAQGWICFCHEDLKFLASPLYFCDMMDKKCFYGVFGGRIVRNMDGKYIQDFVGKILQPNTDGNEVEQLGFDFVDQPEVDALDCVVLFVHSDLFLEYALRFDENLSFHQYVDDLCLQAKEAFDIRSRVCSIPCYHDSNAALAAARLSHPDFDYCDINGAIIPQLVRVQSMGEKMMFKKDV